MMVADTELRFTFRDPDRRKKLEAAFPAIEKMIGEQMKAQALPGLAFGIVIDGELAYAKGFGVVSEGSKQVPDADTVYRIGSINKSFTALTMMSLRDDGVLQLDDPLAKWVPEAAQFVYPTSDSRPITLRQLATHTSGMPRMGTFEPENGPSEEVVLKSLPKLALDTPPGTHWEYSNLGFGLIGIASSHAAKMPYHALVETRILKPLGMTATTWDHDKVPPGKLAPAFAPGPKGLTPKSPARLGAMDGAGSLFSSVRDMAKYVAFQLSAYPARNADDRGPIRRATLREAHSTGVMTFLKHEPPALSASYGFGWQGERSCRFDDMVGHGGAIDSYRAAIRFSPSRGVGIVVMSNFPNANTDAFVERAFVELDKTGALAPRVAEPTPALTDTVKKLLAVYEHWDEAALKAILARPIDPREQSELATYKQLHGKCTDVTFINGNGPHDGVFAIKCERGAFELQINTSSQGLIAGFVGFSRDVEPPKAFATMAKALLSLHNKWDDKIFAKYLTKGPLPAAEMKQRAAMFHTRHGDCKIRRAVHEAFDWGYELACAKEDVVALVVTAPNDPSHILGINLHPVRNAAKKCD